MKYNNGFKARMIQRMSGPHAVSANFLSKEVGVHQPTLSRWLRAASTLPSMGKNSDRADDRRARSTRQWTPEEKLRVVRESTSLNGEELGAFLRREGLHTTQLEDWRARVDEAAKAALSGAKPKKASSSEAKRIKALEKDLHRKDRALAEVTALLALKKKAHLLWGDADDDTPTKRGT